MLGCFIYELHFTIINLLHFKILLLLIGKICNPSISPYRVVNKATDIVDTIIGLIIRLTIDSSVHKNADTRQICESKMYFDITTPRMPSAFDPFDLDKLRLTCFFCGDGGVSVKEVRLLLVKLREASVWSESEIQ